MIPLPDRFGGDVAVAFMPNRKAGIMSVVVLKNTTVVARHLMPADAHVERLVRVGDRVFGYSPEAYALIELSAEWKDIGKIMLLREVSSLSGSGQ